MDRRDYSRQAIWFAEVRIHEQVANDRSSIEAAMARLMARPIFHDFVATPAGPAYQAVPTIIFPAGLAGAPLLGWVPPSVYRNPPNDNWTPFFPAESGEPSPSPWKYREPWEPWVSEPECSEPKRRRLNSATAEMSAGSSRATDTAGRRTAPAPRSAPLQEDLLGTVISVPCRCAPQTPPNQPKVNQYCRLHSEPPYVAAEAKKQQETARKILLALIEKQKQMLRANVMEEHTPEEIFAVQEAIRQANQEGLRAMEQQMREVFNAKEKQMIQILKLIELRKEKERAKEKQMQEVKLKLLHWIEENFNLESEGQLMTEEIQAEHVGLHPVNQALREAIKATKSQQMLADKLKLLTWIQENWIREPVTQEEIQLMGKQILLEDQICELLDNFRPQQLG